MNKDEVLGTFWDAIDISNTYNEALFYRLAQWCWGKPIYIGLPVSLLVPIVFLCSLLLGICFLCIGFVGFGIYQLFFKWGASKW